MKGRNAERHPDPHKIGAKRPSELQVGAAVRYHPVLPPRPGISSLDSKIRSEPWQLGDGSWVVAIEGKAGGVSTQHLEPL